MAHIKNINTVETVSPEGVKFLVVKSGKIAHCDLSATIDKIEKFDPANINKSFSEVEKLISGLTQKVEALEKRLAEVQTVPAEVTETVEDATKSKTAKKAKKAE
jgi:predicted component of type VI protein secretion system